MNLSLTVAGKTFSAEIADPKADPMIIKIDGTEFSVSAAGVKAAAPAAAAPAAGADTIKAPIPGTIQAVNVQPGQSVKKGDVIFILEAMKMKNNIVAMHDGKIATVNVSKGDTVTHGQVLLSYAG